jgi:hypothetical protein
VPGLAVFGNGTIATAFGFGVGRFLVFTGFLSRVFIPSLLLPGTTLSAWTPYLLPPDELV